MTAILPWWARRRNARGVAPPGATMSVELRLLVPRALELEKVRIGGEGHRGIPQLAGFLTARNPRKHRPEERHTVDVDGRRADIVTDRVHAGVVTLAQRLVVGVAGGGLGQVGGQTGLVQRDLDDLFEFLIALVMNLGAHRGV